MEEGGIKGGWRSGCGEGQTVVASVEMELKTVEAEPMIHVDCAEVAGVFFCVATVVLVLVVLYVSRTDVGVVNVLT